MTDNVPDQDAYSDFLRKAEESIISSGGVYFSKLLFNLKTSRDSVFEKRFLQQNDGSFLKVCERKGFGAVYIFKKSWLENFGFSPNYKNFSIEFIRESFLKACFFKDFNYRTCSINSGIFKIDNVEYVLDSLHRLPRGGKEFVIVTTDYRSGTLEASGYKTYVPKCLHGEWVARYLCFLSSFISELPHDFIKNRLETIVSKESILYTPFIKSGILDEDPKENLSTKQRVPRQEVQASPKQQESVPRRSVALSDGPPDDFLPPMESLGEFSAPRRRGKSKESYAEASQRVAAAGEKNNGLSVKGTKNSDTQQAQLPQDLSKFKTCLIASDEEVDGILKEEFPIFGELKFELPEFPKDDEGNSYRPSNKIKPFEPSINPDQEEARSHLGPQEKAVAAIGDFDDDILQELQKIAQYINRYNASRVARDRGIRPIYADINCIFHKSMMSRETVEEKNLRNRLGEIKRLMNFRNAERDEKEQRDKAILEERHVRAQIAERREKERKA